MNKPSATQTDNNNIAWSFWLGVVFFVAVVIGLAVLAWQISQGIAKDEAAPVTRVVIAGEMPYTVKGDIEKAIDNINLSNFFKVDVNQVQKEVANLPWVYSVSVRKNWPNELRIYVVDQIPVAQWNQDFLINQQGQTFQADTKRLTQNLPAFFGPEGSELMALENYYSLNKLLQFNGLAIDQLVLSERFAWQLMLSDGVTLNLGRENRVERVQRFMDLYPEILKHKESNQQVNYVDLRYDTGLAVGWKPLNTDKRA